MSKWTVALIIAIMLVGSLPSGLFAYRAGERSATIQSNICKVVAASASGNPRLFAVWKGYVAQDRAHSGAVWAAMAERDARIQAAYAPSHFHFPGC